MKCQAIEAALRPNRPLSSVRKRFNVQILEDEVANISREGRKGNQIKCWNCDGTGHGHRDCMKKKMVFCYRCGNKGVISRDCSKCQGNQ